MQHFVGQGRNLHALWLKSVLVQICHCLELTHHLNLPHIMHYILYSLLFHCIKQYSYIIYGKTVTTYMVKLPIMIVISLYHFCHHCIEKLVIYFVLV